MLKKIISSFIVCLMFCSQIQFVDANTSVASVSVKNDVQSTGVSITDESIHLYQVLERDGYTYKVSDDYVGYFNDLYLAANCSDDMLDFVIAYLNDSSEYEIMNGLYKYTIEQNISYDYQDIVDKKDGFIEYVVFDSVEIGYYLILKGTAIIEPVASTFLTESNPHVDVYLKATKPTLDKEVYNHSLDDYNNANTASIGDELQYKITTTVPDISSYSFYEYVIYDEMSSGLDFMDNVNIIVNESLESSFILSSDYYSVNKIDSQHFTVTINLFEAIADEVVYTNDILRIYYSAVLNQNAMNTDYSLNTAYLEYSNNPFTNETSTTVEVEVKTHTLQLNVLKISSHNDTPLQGVQFNMTRNGGLMYFVYDKGVYIVSSIDAINSTSTLITNEDGELVIIGLNDYDVYSFIEIVPLAGYLNIDDIQFEFNVTYDTAGNIVYVSSKENGLDNDSSNLHLDLVITNYREIDLPSTGGMGSSMYIAIGSIFVVGSLLLMSILLLKNRKITDDEA